LKGEVTCHLTYDALRGAIQVFVFRRDIFVKARLRQP